MLVAFDDDHAEIVLGFPVCAFSVSWSSEGDSILGFDMLAGCSLNVMIK